MRKMLLVIALLSLLVVLTAAEEVTLVPDFTLPDFKGNMVSLSDFEGLVILDFWATWCPPCRVEVPVLQRLNDQYGWRGLTIIGISVEDIATQQTFIDTMKKEGIPMNYILLIDKDREVFTEYGIQGIPTTIFVGEGFKQLYREVGFTPAFEPKFREIIEENLPRTTSPE